ncbi:Ig-like domain repeat protein [Granulicella aggregans]|uniref:Ig-like domain repeat protein n=1 Tax=Granulicella aggregans TaxID=474949 RepID=UPI0021E04C60|nr:Ig-like domain repeat protein [Granulicella aggregans]
MKEGHPSLNRQTARAFWKGAALSAVALLTAIGSSRASAQTAPAYVVYSQTVLSSSFKGASANYAVNSRGDFFVNDGNSHVLEYPANGGAPITLWTDTNNYGASGVAVDPFDNLYITVFYSPGGNNDADSQVYEFPSTNGSYPAPYVYSSSQPPGSCTPASPATSTTPAVPANTGVCAVGFYIGAAYYYWQPLGIAADGQGNTYMYSNYDNTYGSTSLGIFQCQPACNEQLAGNGATAYTVKLSKTITSIIADYAGNVYFTDESNLNVIPAGSPSTKNTPAVFDSSFSSPYGVTLDASGNMYVSDQNGIWEVPAVETTGGAPCKGGADPCKLLLSAKYKLIPMSGVPGGSAASAAVDNRGNIVYSQYYGNLSKASLWSGNFPVAQIGATGSTSLSFTVSFNSATTIGAFKAVQGVAASTEFAVSEGTCTVGTAFAAGSTCTFSANFTPNGLGVRTGAVVITDSTGAETYTYLTGVGTGTGVTVDPGTPTQIGSGLKTPEGIAVDGAGNVYIADAAANTVQQFPAGGGAGVSLGTGLNVPTGVAVDGGGNVFIVNQGTGATGGSVVEVPSVAGVLTSSAQKTLVSGLNLPTDIVADGDANLYVSLTGSNEVVQLANPSRIDASAAMAVRGYGLSGPTGLALDGSGNLYVADTGNNRVLQLGDGFQNSVGNGLSAPTGVAVDPSGSVMIADGTGRLIRVPNESFGTNAVGLNQADQQVLGSPLSYPYSLRTDATGNLYVSDNVAAVVYQLQRTTGAIDFGSWNLNTVSNAQTIVLSNIGNQDVTVGNPIYPAVPASSEFAVTAGSNSSSCSSGIFHSGFNCTLQATFAPTAQGPSTYPLVISAPAQNASSTTINLTGNGINKAAATLSLIQVAPTTSTISYGQQIIISAKVAPSGSSATPTGYVVFTFDGQNQRPIKLDATGAASITFNGLNAGQNTLSAFYEGDSNYGALDSAVLPLNINLATSMNVLTAVGDSADPLSVQPTDTLTLTDTLTPAVVGSFSGTVTFIDVATNLPLNGMQPIRLGSPDPTTGNYVVSYQLTGAKAGNYNVKAVYSGNVDYLSNQSSTIPYIVIKTTYTVTADNTTVTASATAPATINLVVTDYSNYQGAVSLQCSGLPANAYCVFRPASAQLIPASGVLPNTQLTPLTIYPVPVVLQIKVDQNLIPIESSSFFWIVALVSGLAIAWRRRLTSGGLGLLSLMALLCFAGLTVMSGCGSSINNNFPTPAGSYPVTITATSTPLVNGAEPTCSYQNCNLPPDPVTNPSINVVQTLSVNLTVK